MIYLILVLTMFMSTSCFMPQSVIDKYSQCYNNETNGIDTICNINGFYYMKSSNPKYTMSGASIMLYKDGTIAVEVHTYSKMDSLIDQLNKGKKVKSVIPDDVRRGDKLYKMNTLSSWGSYYLKEDTIIAQIFYYHAMSPSGIIEKRYKILNDTSIIFCSGKVIAKEGGQKGVDSIYYAKPNWKPFIFISLKEKPPSICWLKSKRWFWCDKKEFKEYKKWKKKQQ